MSQGKGGSIIASAKCHTGGMYPTAGNVSGSDTMPTDGGSNLEEKAAELDSVAATSTAPTTTVVAGEEGLQADGITLEVDEMTNPSTAVMDNFTQNATTSVLPKKAAAELCEACWGRQGSISATRSKACCQDGQGIWSW